MAEQAKRPTKNRRRERKNVPVGHAVGSLPPSSQYAPAGHGNEPLAGVPLGQKKPARHRPSLLDAGDVPSGQ